MFAIKKKCNICGKEFLDITLNHIGKYCSKLCRNKSDNNHNKEYMRKRRLGLYRLGLPNNRIIGTITDKQLDNRINRLLNNNA